MKKHCGPEVDIARKDQVQQADEIDDDTEEPEEPAPKKRPAAKRKAKGTGRGRGKGRGKGKGRGRGSKVTPEPKAKGKAEKKKHTPNTKKVKEVKQDEPIITPKRKAGKYSPKSSTPAPAAKVKATFARRRCPKTEPACEWHKCVRGAFEKFVEEHVVNPSKMEDFLR